MTRLSKAHIESVRRSTKKEIIEKLEKRKRNYKIDDWGKGVNWGLDQAIKTIGGKNEEEA